jgi:putative addiction module component (TIGR02574 family)
MNEIVEQVKKLPLSERIQVVEDIWDSIAEESAEVFQASPAEREELRRRYAAHQASPSSGIPWQEVRARLFKAGD